MSEAEFVGRAETLSALQSQLARGERLVTLTGAAGLGKTRVARRFTRGDDALLFAALGDATPVTWCDCGLAVGRDGLLRALAAALGAALVRDDALEAVADALSLRGAMVLVLDHLDPVLDEARAALPALLSSCPELHVIATARTPVGLEQEVCVALTALDAPECAALWASHGGRSGDASTLREVITLLGQNPLAIELAARADAKTPLGARCVELARSAGADGALSLDGAIATAWSALVPREATALAEASVFAGSFSLEAAGAVLSGGASGTTSLPAILSDLSARGLLRAREDDAGRRVRFSLDEPVRSFASRELARAEGETRVMTRHAEHYLACGAEGMADYLYRGMYEGAASLDREHANLAAVAARAGQIHETPAARSLARLRALVYQTPTVARRAALSSHLDLVDRALDEAEAAGVAEGDLLEAMCVRAWRHERASRHDEALHAYERCLARAVAAKRVDLEGHVLRAIALTKRRQGLVDEALALAGKARASLERGDRLGESAWALLLAGQIRYETGSLDGAVSDLSRALARARQHGNDLVEAQALLALGEAELARGRHAEARALLSDAVEALRRTENLGGVATAREATARLLHDQGRTDTALAEFRAAVAQATLLGDRYRVACFEVSLGALLHEFGHLAEARVLLDRSRAPIAARSLRVAAFARAHLAAALASCGELDAADGEIAEARVAVAAPGDRLTSVIRALRVFVILCRARELPMPEARAVAREARHELAEIQALPPEERGVELRIAMRLLSGFDGDELLRPSAELVRPRALVAQRAGLWFIAPDAPEVSLRTRTTLATLLRRLGEQRHGSPGRSLTPESLISDMWPGEKIIPKAARNRLHVAVRTLRTMGLGGILRSDVEGYHLDPTVPFQFTGEETSPA